MKPANTRITFKLSPHSGLYVFSLYHSTIGRAGKICRAARSGLTGILRMRRAEPDAMIGKSRDDGKEARQAMRSMIVALGITGLVAGACSAPTQPRVSEQTVPSHRAQALQAALAEAGKGAPGALVRVVSAQEGAWSGTLGQADTAARTPMPADDVVRIGSVTKSFVMALTLRAVQEGRWQLDDPIGPKLTARHAQTLPNLDRITFRQLLQHTSGIYNYTNDAEVQAESVRNPSRHWNVEELLSAAARHPPAFEPGQGVAYCSTSYLLLALALEAAYGQPWTTLVDEKLARPLGLRRTFLPTDEHLPGQTRGYGLSFLGLPRPEHSTLHPSIAGATGGMASTAQELGTFFQALFDGQLLDSQRQADMRTVIPATRPGYYFGLGLEAHDTPAGRLLGKNGEINGFSTTVMQLADRTMIVAIANEGPGGASKQLAFSAAEAWVRSATP